MNCPIQQPMIDSKPSGILIRPEERELKHYVVFLPIICLFFSNKQIAKKER